MSSDSQLKPTNSLTPTPPVIRSAALMSAGTLISRVLGLVRDIVIAYFFSRTETDSFFVAFRIPNFFRRFLGEGALSVSFIPIFIECLNSPTPHLSSQNRATNFMNSVYTILLVVVCALTVLGVFFIDSLIENIFTNTPFAAIEGKVQMTIIMARILFVYLFFVTLYAYLMGIANAVGRFFIPATAPALLNVCMIVFAFLPKHLVSVPPLLLCWAVLLGGFIQVLLVASLLFRLGFLPKLTWNFTGTDLKKMAKRFFPGILGVGGLAIIGVLNLYFSSWLEEGTHTAIYYADRLLELPRSLIAISFGTALLPSLSNTLVKNKKQALLNIAAKQRDTLLFLILPCAVGFWYLGLPIVKMLFQTGQFDSITSQRTALVLQIYSVLLVTSSLSSILAVCFYSMKNTWYPACACGLYILFHWFLTPFMLNEFGLEGLIWATVISSAFFLSLLVIAYPFYIGCFYWKRSIKNLLWYLPPMTILFLYLYSTSHFFDRVLSTHMEEKSVQICVVLFTVFSSIAVYIGSSVLLGLPQAKECINLFKKKNKMKKN